MSTPENINNAKTDVGAAVAAGLAMAISPEVIWLEPIVEKHPLMVLPAHLKVEDLARFLPVPLRLNQTVRLDTPEAFAAYLNGYGNPKATSVFANRQTGTFHAAIDYHEGAATPSWVGHNAWLTLRHTEAWTEWTAKNKQPQNQIEFAQFLEDHIPDISHPDGADLVEVARKFEAKKNVNFKSTYRAQDGSVEFTYNEEVTTGGSGSGVISVPHEFMLMLKPYEGMEPHAITARLRYSIEAGGKLRVWYELVRPRDVLDAAFAQAFEIISSSAKEKIRGILYGELTPR